MRILSLDIGKRRTGVAYGDSEADTIVALPPIDHRGKKDLLDAVERYVRERSVEKIVVGLPLLPGGAHGEQAEYTMSVADEIAHRVSLPLTFVDERYSSISTFVCDDPDTVAACTILEVALSQAKDNV